MSDDEITKIANALKPPRCPKCGAEIDGLTYYEKAWNKADFYLNPVYDAESGKELYRSSEYMDWDTVDVIEVEYRCPKCDEVLFKDDEDAKKFLTGEEDVQKTAQV